MEREREFYLLWDYLHMSVPGKQYDKAFDGSMNPRILTSGRGGIMVWNARTLGGYRNPHAYFFCICLKLPVSKTLVKVKSQ